ncbi:MAG: hypothetical protein QM775_14430 [Pirellulales bacterium]
MGSPVVSNGGAVLAHGRHDESVELLLLKHLLHGPTEVQLVFERSGIVDGGCGQSFVQKFANSRAVFSAAC